MSGGIIDNYLSKKILAFFTHRFLGNCILRIDGEGCPRQCNTSIDTVRQS